MAALWAKPFRVERVGGSVAGGRWSVVRYQGPGIEKQIKDCYLS
jgi:hypothetical protein